MGPYSSKPFGSSGSASEGLDFKGVPRPETIRDDDLDLDGVGLPLRLRLRGWPSRPGSQVVQNEVSHYILGAPKRSHIGKSIGTKSWATIHPEAVIGTYKLLS